jgi:hypothetical protein
MLGEGGHLGLAVVEVAVVAAVVVIVEVVIAVVVRTTSLTIMQQHMIMASTFIPDFRSTYGTVFQLLYSSRSEYLLLKI